MQRAQDLLGKLYLTNVVDVMTPAVICVDSELDMQEVVQLFERSRISCAPVVEDEGVLVGLISRSDVMRGRPRRDSETTVPPFPPNHVGVLVEDVMTKDVASVRETAPLAEAIHLMASQGVHRLPVLSHRDAVVGILSMTDVVRWLANQLPAESPRAEPEISC
jgi:CBS domain-containing protein